MWAPDGAFEESLRSPRVKRKRELPRGNLRDPRPVWPGRNGRVEFRPRPPSRASERVVALMADVPACARRRPSRCPPLRARLRPTPRESVVLEPPIGRAGIRPHLKARPYPWYLRSVDRSRALTRKTSLRKLDGAFDAAVLQQTTPAQRFCDTLNLTQEIWRLKGRDPGERGLSRPVARVVRR